MKEWSLEVTLDGITLDEFYSIILSNQSNFRRVFRKRQGHLLLDPTESKWRQMKKKKNNNKEEEDTLDFKEGDSTTTLSVDLPPPPASCMLESWPSMEASLENFNPSSSSSGMKKMDRQTEGTKHDELKDIQPPLHRVHEPFLFAPSSGRLDFSTCFVRQDLFHMPLPLPKMVLHYVFGRDQEQGPLMQSTDFLFCVQSLQDEGKKGEEEEENEHQLQEEWNLEERSLGPPSLSSKFNSFILESRGEPVRGLLKDKFHVELINVVVSSSSSDNRFKTVTRLKTTTAKTQLILKAHGRLTISHLGLNAMVEQFAFPFCRRTHRAWVQLVQEQVRAYVKERDNRTGVK